MCALPSAPSPRPPLRTGVDWLGEEGWGLSLGSPGVLGFALPFAGMGRSGSLLEFQYQHLLSWVGCSSLSQGAASNPAVGSEDGETGGGYLGHSLGVIGDGETHGCGAAGAQPLTSLFALSRSKAILGFGW